jgi:RPA family protein
MVEKRRLPARKVKIKSLTGGKFVQQNGFNPSYVLSPDGQRLARVRLLATIVDKFVSEDKKFSSITLDDGSDTIRAKAFNSLILEQVAIGDIVDVIGRVRQYNEELYIVPEVLWKVGPEWEMLRELEIRKEKKEIEKIKTLVLKYQKQTSDVEELKRLMAEFGVEAEEVEAIIEAQSNVEEDETIQAEQLKERILELIGQLDHGDGADYGQLIEASGLPETKLDTIIEELLNDGSCFEPRPGKIKRL